MGRKARDGKESPKHVSRGCGSDDPLHTEEARMMCEKRMKTKHEAMEEFMPPDDGTGRDVVW